MRLGQLSRKLSISTSHILEFLSTKNIQIENDSNARVEDEHVKLIMQHFFPAQAIETPTQKPADEVQPLEDLEATSPPLQSDPDLAPAVIDEEIQDAVIKAPKIELSGLKILGKIELPESKKKESSDTQAASEQEEIELSEQPRRPDRKKSFKDRTERNVQRKNPIAQQREHEALEAERKRQERIAQEKEQRTQNYLRRVKTVAATKSARLIEEPTEELLKTEELPTTFFGKLLRWLKS